MRFAECTGTSHTPDCFPFLLSACLILLCYYGAGWEIVVWQNPAASAGLGSTGSVGNHHNFAARDKDGKEGDTGSFSHCLRPSERCSVAAVRMGAHGEEWWAHYLQAACGELAPLHQHRRRALPCSRCLLLLPVFAAACLWWGATVRYLLPVITFSLNSFSFHFSLSLASEDSAQSIILWHIRKRPQH